MLYTIQNSQMRVTIDSLGAQLMSITAADGTEYLWGGDEAYWRNRAPNLFPYVGRLTEGRCTYGGKSYEMTRHGFANRTQFSALESGADHITLHMEDSGETRAVYPFAFAFDLVYALSGSTLSVTYRVTNRDGKEMYFGLGAHPGFRVPLEPGKAFTDYRLTFAQPCQPWQVLMSDDYLINGQEAPYPLEGGRSMPLRHDLFDHDAIILKNMDRTVTLSAGEGSRGVTVSYPRMRYLGVWHKPESDAPYVCLEPWLSLPSRHGVVEDLSQQNDLMALCPGETYENRWTVTIF
jgi:galactose mutarotase-like enzyme